MWTAEITNDPTHQHRLYIELLEDDLYRGRVELDKSGQSVLTIYPGATSVSVPGTWLINLLRGAEQDLSVADYQM
ncbi:MAG: hypothetical protein KA765_08015 [Thermoflexales bacterium]|nr:hypothetical protein [Thermoflexales bacterium]